jgi:hypothetical protein
MDIAILNKSKNEKEEPPKDLSRKKETLEQRLRLSPLGNSGSSSNLQTMNTLKRGANPLLKLDRPSPSKHNSKSGTELAYESLEASRVYEIEQNKKELTILKKLAVEKDKKIGSLERQIEGA